MGRQTYILPDFIIIGANKAGTTSVSRYLGQHPSIKISDPKEPMFFAADPGRSSPTKADAAFGSPYLASTLAEYSDLFAGYGPSVRLFGEGSTAYLANPAPSSRLIRKLVPDVKLIAVLREPASRAVSAYKMCYGNGMEKRSFSEVVDRAPEQSRILPRHGVREYIRNGLYSQLLEPYLRLFERRQILMLRYDDLEADAARFLDSILKFLGVESLDLDTSKRHNPAERHLTTPVEIGDDDVARLREFYRKDIRKLEARTGLDLKTWLE
jgi:hypothetical protein